ncbi:MAG: hypothetical protein ACOX2M_03695 [Fastidiosipilaceae bacterium]|jgi:cell division protein FtsW (lipid II flippase)
MAYIPPNIGLGAKIMGTYGQRQFFEALLVVGLEFLLLVFIPVQFVAKIVIIGIVCCFTFFVMLFLSKEAPISTQIKWWRKWKSNRFLRFKNGYAEYEDYKIKRTTYKKL